MATVTEHYEAAARAGLVYVTDGQPGISQKRAGKGWAFYGPRGKRISDKKERQRILSLVIPPAWTDIWVCPNPKGHIQVTARDLVLLSCQGWDDNCGLGATIRRLCEQAPHAIPIEMASAELRRVNFASERVPRKCVREDLGMLTNSSQKILLSCFNPSSMPTWTWVDSPSNEE